MLELRKNECVRAFALNNDLHDKHKPKHPSPLSLRLTHEERARLERDAGDSTLSSYIRWRLFGENAAPSGFSRRPKRKSRRPHVDHVILAQLLGALGKSRLASNLNQIAKAANIGALPVTKELEVELHEACAEISEMRNALMQALGKAAS